MPAARVRLSPIDVSRLINPFEAGDAVFLVELGALGEIGDTVKVLYLKEIGSAFGPGSDDLGCNDLSKMLAGQVLAVVFEQRHLQAKDISDGLVPRCQWPVFEQCFRSDGFDIRRRVERQRVRSAAQDPD